MHLVLMMMVKWMKRSGLQMLLRVSTLIYIREVCSGPGLESPVSSDHPWQQPEQKQKARGKSRENRGELAPAPALSGHYYHRHQRQSQPARPGAPFFHRPSLLPSLPPRAPVTSSALRGQHGVLSSHHLARHRPVPVLHTLKHLAPFLSADCRQIFVSFWSSQKLI